MTVSESGGAWAGSARAATTPWPSRSGRDSRETMHRRLFSTVRQARLEIFQWLTYYNARRRHSALNYLSPAELE
ncbi:integrase core domain-containing protein [Streptomyces sp. 1-11]|uniref:integrase core domain-containing protein n=1 Tax=Streptomyces sp. 1-11 TaxID=2590549 RepID=UPI0035A29D04